MLAWIKKFFAPLLGLDLTNINGQMFGVLDPEIGQRATTLQINMRRTRCVAQQFSDNFF